MDELFSEITSHMYEIHAVCCNFQLTKSPTLFHHPSLTARDVTALAAVLRLWYHSYGLSGFNVFWK